MNPGSSAQATHGKRPAAKRGAGARRWRGGAAALLASAVLLCASGCERRQAAVLAQPLHIPLNIKCTTCNDFIRCEAAQPAAATTAPAARAPLLLFRLGEMSFWDQAGTIFHYLFQFVRPWTQAERPLTLYRDTGKTRTIEGNMVAQLDTTTATVTTPLGVIDQRTGAWTGADGAALGRCGTLRRRDGFRIVREYLGRPISGVRR